MSTLLKNSMLCCSRQGPPRRMRTSFMIVQRMCWRYQVGAKGRGWRMRTTIHAPPPELARQCLMWFLEAWVETPLDTGGLFFVPRVVPGFWRGLSRHIHEVGILPAELFPTATGLPIPVVVLIVFPHTRCLSLRPKQVDSDRSPGNNRGGHQREADRLRSLQGVCCR